jgi:hypothetical protein
MRLSELKAGLLTRHEEDGRTIYRPTASLADADGIQFLCPKCFAQNSGPVRTHSCICWFVGKVPDTAEPGPGRWKPSGTGIEDLTFVPYEGQPRVSVQLIGGCGWHGNIVSGEAQDC